MKPIIIEFTMPKTVMRKIEQLHGMVTLENKDCMVMLQVYGSGYTVGCWLPVEWAKKAQKLGKQIVKDSRK